MKPNQSEGVQWLRKAAESASVEIADDEGQIKEGKFVDAVERKTRKAQFALSIYELGVSHMNGWGIEQDKVLALRCFEIAGGRFILFQQAFLRTNSLQPGATSMLWRKPASAMLRVLAARGISRRAQSFIAWLRPRA